MNDYFFQNKQYRLSILAGAFVITLSLFWSIISRATNIFFLSNQKRLIVTGLIFIFSFIIFILFLLNKKICNFIARNIKSAGKFFIIPTISVLIISASLFLSNLLPTVSIPINHILIIRLLPDDEKDKNVVHIESINEMIDAPEIGSNLVDPSNIRFSDGNFVINDNEITLEEGAKLTYSSFYSGCMRVVFSTTPESRKVIVQFDNVLESYSLNSTERSETEINLCSRFPINQLSFKWKVISICNYFFNIVALASIFIFEIFYIFYKKRGSNDVS